MLQNGLALLTASGLCSFYVFQRLHLLDLLYQIRLLVIELFVLGPVRMEPRQKLDELIAIPKQYFLNRTWLVWVCHKHLHTDTEIQL